MENSCKNTYSPKDADREFSVDNVLWSNKILEHFWLSNGKIGLCNEKLRVCCILCFFFLFRQLSYFSTDCFNAMFHLSTKLANSVDDLQLASKDCNAKTFVVSFLTICHARWACADFDCSSIWQHVIFPYSCDFDFLLCFEYTGYCQTPDS